MRGLEYELDFVTNRANRDLQVSNAAVCTVSLAVCSVHPRSFMVIWHTRSFDGHLRTKYTPCNSFLNGWMMLQAVREKAAIQAMEFQKEREQLMTELSKVKSRAGLADKPSSRQPLGSLENIRA